MVLYTALWLSKELILYCNSGSVDSVFIGFIGFNLLHTNLEQKTLFFTNVCHFKQAIDTN